jgi:hypothetical protein
VDNLDVALAMQKFAQPCYKLLIILYSGSFLYIILINIGSSIIEF